MAVDEGSDFGIVSVEESQHGAREREREGVLGEPPARRRLATRRRGELPGGRVVGGVPRLRRGRDGYRHRRVEGEAEDEAAEADRPRLAPPRRRRRRGRAL